MGEKNMKNGQNRVYRRLNNFAQEPSNLADQQSRFDRHIVIDDGKWSLSEADLWEV